MKKWYIAGSLVVLLLLSVMPILGSGIPLLAAYVVVTLVAITMMRKKIFQKHSLIYFTLPFFALTFGAIFETGNVDARLLALAIAEKSKHPAENVATKTAKMTEKTVIGHYPEYIQMAKQIDAHIFNISMDVWNKMSEAERWNANQEFLDAAIQRGDDFFLATHPEKVKPGSSYQKELQYLLSKGYKPNADGTRLIPPDS